MYLILFDIPKGHSTLSVKVNRNLKDIGAKKMHNSAWQSNNLKELTKITIWIRNVGGSAHILEEKIIY